MRNVMATKFNSRPHLDQVVKTCRNNMLPIGTEGDRRNIIRVSSQRRHNQMQIDICGTSIVADKFLLVHSPRFESFWGSTSPKSSPTDTLRITTFFDWGRFVEPQKDWLVNQEEFYKQRLNSHNDCK
jgi:hypothetical protein